MQLNDFLNMLAGIDGELVGGDDPVIAVYDANGYVGDIVKIEHAGGNSPIEVIVEKKL